MIPNVADPPPPRQFSSPHVRERQVAWTTRRRLRGKPWEGEAQPHGVHVAEMSEVHLARSDQLDLRRPSWQTLEYFHFEFTLPGTISKWSHCIGTTMVSECAEASWETAASI
jgi:hypothetical protein